MTRNRVVWWLEIDALEEGTDHHVYMTKGWQDDSDILRWALAKALQQEGTHNGWHSAWEALEDLEITWDVDEEEQKVTVAAIPLEPS